MTTMAAILLLLPHANTPTATTTATVVMAKKAENHTRVLVMFCCFTAIKCVSAAAATAAEAAAGLLPAGVFPARPNKANRDIIKSNFFFLTPHCLSLPVGVFQTSNAVAYGKYVGVRRKVCAGEILYCCCYCWPIERERHCQRWNGGILREAMICQSEIS